MMSKKLFIVLFLLIIISAGITQNSSEVLTIELSGKDDSFPLGQKTYLEVKIFVKSPYHINSGAPLEEFLIPSTLVFSELEGVVFGKPEFPPAETRKLELSDVPMSVYEGEIIIKCPLTISESYKKSDILISGIFGYQACDESSCLAPQKLGFKKTFKVKKAAEKKSNRPDQESQSEIKSVKKKDNDSGVLSDAQSKENNLISNNQKEPEKQNLIIYDSEESISKDAEFAGKVAKKGLFLTFILIFLGGLALNLTPCVYPIIPITISYFGGQSEGRKGGAVIHAIFYVLGMAITYSALGVIAALTGNLFGAAMQNPFVLIGIAFVLFALALSMFDLYEFRLPSFLTGLAGGRKKGLIGTLLMGLTVGLVAAPCIGPFVLGLLTYVGEKGNVVLGFLMFFVLALGLGLPFLFLAIFSGSITKLPKSGSWMVWVRTIFGFILIAMAVYFLKPLFPNPLFYNLTLAMVLLIGGIYMAWIEPTKMGNKVFPLIRNIIGSIFFGLSLFIAVSGIESYIEHKMDDIRIEAGSLMKSDRVEWNTFSHQKMSEARQQSKPVLLDFYADWCIPCKELDKATFPDKKIVDISEKFVMLKVDLTTPNHPVYGKLREEYKVKGVPTLIFINSKGKEVPNTRVVGFLKPEELLKIMKESLESQ